MKYFFQGDAGDSLGKQRNQPFTTKDRDHDVWSIGNCAKTYKGAWWHASCFDSNLNALYLNGLHSERSVGINWRTWKGMQYSAKKAEMKIRPINWTHKCTFMMFKLQKLFWNSEQFNARNISLDAFCQFISSSIYSITKSWPDDFI